MSGFIVPRLSATQIWRLVAVASLIVASFAIAYSIGRAQPAAAPEIEACVNKFTGVARMSPTGGALNCQSHETLRTWNVAGVPGTDGVAGYDLVSETKSLTEASTIAQGVATCPIDKKVVGGGVSLLQTSWKITQSRPFSNRSWGALAIGPAVLPAGSAVLDIFAICANVAE